MKNYLIYASLFACGIITACKPQNQPADEGAKGTYISVADSSQGTAPYTITLVEMPQNYAPALQSFAWANVGNKLLIVGGRTNGFHGFDTVGGTFPTKKSNTYMYVVDMDSATTDSLPVPAKYLLQLSSTNMEGYNEDGKTLYCIGGYGSNCAADSPSCYQTYPLLTAIDIPAAMSAIQSGNTQALENSITTIEDERMRVTGGELHKIGEWFYLVVGQNFDTIYNINADVTGKYTQEIRRFHIEKKKDGTLAIKNYKAYKDLWGGNWKDQLHRRDLVVLESVMADGTTGITVYGGVFTPVNDNAYTNPFYILQDKNGKPSFALDTVFSQKFCLYAAPSVALYNPANKTMYTSILGGISQYYFDSTGHMVNSNGAMPFTNNITTIVRNPNGSSAEYPQQTPVLPGTTGLIGAESIFIPAKGIAMYAGTNRVIDMSKLPASGNVTLGVMYGGISAQAAQSTQPYPTTVASNKIYQVILSR